MADPKSEWHPIAVLPNVFSERALGNDQVALVPWGDQRLIDLCSRRPMVAEFLSRFRTAFGLGLRPMVIIARGPKPAWDSITSFRDAVSISVVAYGRALATIHPRSSRIAYSDAFRMYPWTIANDDTLIVSNPAILGLHVVEEFQGQSTPEYPVVEIRDVDDALLDELLRRWQRHYRTSRPKKWEDRALFRSLNMAGAAAALPSGGKDPLLFDLGRSIGLWVSAFETLTHRGGRRDQGLASVYERLRQVVTSEKRLSVRRYLPYGEKTARGTLLLKMYGDLYQARNAFLHGNRVTVKTISPRGGNDGLFWLAPCLYELALASFVGVNRERPPGYWLDAAQTPQSRRARRDAMTGDDIERAVQRYRQKG